MITIIGVGHVFQLSDNIKDVIRSRRPEVVCLELDPARFRALTDKTSRGSVPLQYRILAYIQKRMADKFGSEVGDEMLAAVSAAKEIGAQVALIDMDATKVFAQLWARMSFKERAHLLGGALVGLFLTKQTVEREMERYEEHQDKYIETLGEGFPTIKEVLIDDRNKFMAANISSISASHGSVVAVVGDGHVPGLLEALKPLEVETVRLKELRKPHEPTASGAEISSSFWYSNQ
jgi:pheromone shutdown protein TraB